MKILLVATVVKTHIMEFHIPYLKMMKELGWETAVAAKNDYDIPSDCIIPYCDTYYDIPFERNPLKIRNIKAYRKLKKLIDSEKFDIIHCHTPVGAMLTRLAAVKARKKGSKVFYTAHGFHFYTGAPLVNWMLYYPVEKWLAHKTDVLITINKEDYKRAQKFKAREIVYVPGVGIDLNRFNKQGDREKKKKELGLSDNAFVLLSVGEVNKNKNHKIVINALKELPNCWYVVCGKGPLFEENRELANNLGVANRFIQTGYQDNVEDFYHMADIFVFPSYREGLPVSIMEAMASGLPVVCTKIRGNCDLIQEGKGGYYFNPNDLTGLIDILKKMISNPAALTQMGNYNKKQSTNYSIINVARKVKSLYLQK